MLVGEINYTPLNEPKIAPPNPPKNSHAARWPRLVREHKIIRKITSLNPLKIAPAGWRNKLYTPK